MLDVLDSQEVLDLLRLLNLHRVLEQLVKLGQVGLLSLRGVRRQLRQPRQLDLLGRHRPPRGLVVLGKTRHLGRSTRLVQHRAAACWLAAVVLAVRELVVVKAGEDTSTHPCEVAMREKDGRGARGRECECRLREASA